ncbi:hypothetical protein FHR81_003543 [Actinoalloteichus hoggarensis]|uniref:Uncharacterized protein n=1 Tax=Actinoalloteichus hoggarensis TaxID=1470176 RepID=A0A221W806_9PSEU|nr:DUF3618 domain-containing protein [Actinoalloteichus hoggarensis]ASO21894.1 hypothetical protein AHOG_21390 [Actinoalloteichus hoggarensis]MBB5922491.1 hypothetical protein [Actinoalloteichus hoggarensis]
MSSRQRRPDYDRPRDDRTYAVSEEVPSTQARPDGPSDPGDLRLDIELTREELGDTVEALAQKFDVSNRLKGEFHGRTDAMRASASHLGERAEAWVSRASEKLPPPVSRRFDQAVSSVRENPGPAAAVTLVALLVLRRLTRRQR